MTRLFPLPLAVAVMATGCLTLGDDGLGADGEACHLDTECRVELLCLDGVCGVKQRQWPLATEPEELPYPQGLYRGTSVTFTNSNRATRTLQPYTRTAFRDSGIRPGFILALDGGRTPFLLHTGPVGGTPPDDLAFLADPLGLEPLTGSSLELGAEPVEFTMVATPPNTAPGRHFFLLFRGEGFDVPVPIAPAQMRGATAENGAGADMTLLVEGYILRSHAQQVPVSTPSPSTLDDLLGGASGADADFNRDGVPEGWTVRLEITAERARF